MRHIIWKSRISLLWGAVAVLTLMHMILELATPGAIDELRAGSLHGMDTDGPVTIMWVLFVLVPLLMAFLTFVLPDGPNRWANGVIGALCAVLWVPLPGSEETVTPGAIAVTASVILASALIVAFAWKAPAPQHHQATQPRVLHGAS